LASGLGVADLAGEQDHDPDGDEAGRDPADAAPGDAGDRQAGEVDGARVGRLGRVGGVGAGDEASAGSDGASAATVTGRGRAQVVHGSASVAAGS
jgi:hypothetical protein